MAKRARLSEEVSKEDPFNLFNRPQSQADFVNKEVTIDYGPASAIVAASSPPSIIDITVPGLTSYYVDLSRSRLQVSVKITKKDGTSLTDPKVDKVSFIAYPLATLFKSVEFFLNNTQFGADVQGYQSIKAYLDLILDNDGNYVDTKAATMLALLDKAGAMEAQSTNSGYTAREL